MKEYPILFHAEMVRALLDGRKTQTRRLLTRGHCASIPRWLWERLEFDDAKVPAGAPWALADDGYWHIPCRPHPEDNQIGENWTRKRVYPRWEVGDRLWVKETWTPRDERSIYYLADKMLRHFKAEQPWLRAKWEAMQPPVKERWVPSIYMPRWASRITLEVTAVRAECLQQISEEDAKAEGCTSAEPVSGWTYLLADGRTLQSGIDDPPFAYRSRARREFVPAVTAIQSYRDLWDKLNGKKAPWTGNPPLFAVAFRRITL